MAHVIVPGVPRLFICGGESRTRKVTHSSLLKSLLAGYKQSVKIGNTYLRLVPLHSIFRSRLNLIFCHFITGFSWDAPLNLEFKFQGIVAEKSDRDTLSTLKPTPILGLRAGPGCSNVG